MDSSQESFLQFVQASKEFVGLPTNAPAISVKPRTLRFDGEVSRVVGSIEEQMDQTCWCDVAVAVVERKSSACVIAKSLVEHQLQITDQGPAIKRKTIGITMRPHPVLITDVAALGEVCPGLNTQAIPPSEPSCGGSSGYNYDVVARAKIGLIRERP